MHSFIKIISLRRNNQEYKFFLLMRQSISKVKTTNLKPKVYHFLKIEINNQKLSHLPKFGLKKQK
jgi:hypothetical protein